MEFERVGKNTVQCHMTVEEMNEYGLRIEDFFTNQEKSRDFLEHLVERAEEEIGYEVEGGMISMQLMRMPDDSLIITFSDRSEEGLQGMLNQIQNLAGMVDSDTVAAGLEELLGKDELSDKGIHYSEDMKEFEKALKNARTLENSKQGKKKKKRQTAMRLYRFSGLSALEDCVETLALSDKISCKLYRDKKTGNWYLVLKKGRLQKEEYSYVCNHLQEYGVLLEGQPYADRYCQEHYEAVAGVHALHKIKAYLS